MYIVIILDYYNSRIIYTFKQFIMYIIVNTYFICYNFKHVVNNALQILINN